jgi:hypothetical protein
VAAAPPTAETGSAVQVGAAGGTYIAAASAETWVIGPGSGAAVIEGFDPALDTLAFAGIAPNSLIHWDPGAIGIPGVGITWAGGAGGVILAGLDRLPDSQVLFA